MFKHLLVPTDGSELSEGTVRRAISFAKDAGARITFFYAQPDFPMPIYGEGALIDPTTPEQFARASALEADEILSRAKAAAETEGVAAATDTTVNEVPYEAIIDAAADRCADLVVVGASKRRGSAAAVIGNTAELVAGELPCDVLIVPTPAEQPFAPGVRSQVG